VTIIAYPIGMLVFIMLMMLLVSMCLSVDAEANAKAGTRAYLPNVDKEWHGMAAARSAASMGRIRSSKGYFTPHRGASMPPPCGEDYAPPVLSRDCLTPFSQKVYACYAYFCCTIPSLMVFGLPLLMMGLYIPYPQEMFCILSLTTSVLVFANGAYMVVFGSCAIAKMSNAFNQEGPLGEEDPPEVKQAEHWSGTSSACCKNRVTHWVLLPQYLEDVEVVSLALRSISKSTLATSSISIVLAMEEREEGAEQKASLLKSRFAGSFAEILITLHPHGLPDDPPGKASNLKWAYESLLTHLWASRQDFSEVLLTVSDADSEFHERYFEHLKSSYLEVPQDERNLRIFQAPIFHIKNYHRQPSLVIVGTMFTAMQEMANAGDPNSTQFPYSTYSLSLELVRRVGGFDPEWIAEDWHMGIKCYLLTLGHATIQPIMLPILNFTPEDTSWWGTLIARWSQAKRHALGFSDLAYYFMMLPLIFAYASSKSSESRMEYLWAFGSMALHGLRLVNRIISCHVIVGVITPYGILQFIFRIGMHCFMSPERHAEDLWYRTSFWFSCILIGTVSAMFLVTSLFNVTYHLSKGRIEEEQPGPSVIFRHNLIHWAYTAFCFLVFGPLYFCGLSYAVCRAALMLLVSPTFEYEVAKKITVPNLPEKAGG